MAGKKGSKKSKDTSASKSVSDPALASEPSNVDESQELPEGIAPTTDAPADAVNTEVPEPPAPPEGEPAPAPAPELESHAPPSTSSRHGEEGAAELVIAQREIEQLRKQLEEKDEIIAKLRRELDSRPAPAAASRSNEDMARLQERLAQLRRDQADADSAREAAWRQLKTVVADINRLAQPDTSAKLATAAAS